MNRLLSSNKIGQQLEGLNNWQLDQHSLTKEVNFNSFGEAIQFVNAVAMLAERHDHHPDIEIYFTVVRLTLTTKDLNGISTLDFVLAKEIDTFLKN